MDRTRPQAQMISAIKGAVCFKMDFEWQSRRMQGRMLGLRCLVQILIIIHKCVHQKLYTITSDFSDQPWVPAWIDSSIIL